MHLSSERWNPYTDRPVGNEDFYQEFQNRDGRLNATLRYPGIRDGKLALPVFSGYARLGYQPIKLMVDATNADDKTESTQALQLIRLEKFCSIMQKPKQN